MSLQEKQRQRLERLKASGVAILDELPAGWRISGHGVGDCLWANNGKSRFGGGYEHALVKRIEKDIP